MPREKRPSGQDRDKVIQVRLTKEELATVEAAAEKEKMDRSAWARVILLWEAAKPTAMPEFKAKMLKDLRAKKST